MRALVTILILQLARAVVISYVLFIYLLLHCIEYRFGIYTFSVLPLLNWCSIMGFTGRVCAITGGGSGIGFAIAERLGAAGATVILFDVNKSALDGAKDKLSAKGVDASAMVVDVTDPSAVEAAFAKIEKRYKRLDALIQAAGITGKTGIKTHEVDPQNFDLVYKINVKGIFLCCKYALPLMVKQKYGRIVNIASVAGKEGNAGMLAYSTSSCRHWSH